MVSLRSLYLFAAATLLLAVVVGRLRRTPPGDALRDGRAALLGTLAALLAATALFALSRPPVSWELGRLAGSGALLASPVGAALALSARGRRSVPRALLASGLALAGAVLWLTLQLEGPGAWSLFEVALTLPGLTLAVASGACLGWWTRRGPRGPTDRATGG